MLLNSHNSSEHTLVGKPLLVFPLLQASGIRVCSEDLFGD